MLEKQKVDQCQWSMVTKEQDEEDKMKRIGLGQVI